MKPKKKTITLRACDLNWMQRGYPAYHTVGRRRVRIELVPIRQNRARRRRAHAR
jgi:hypothetical protein